MTKLLQLIGNDFDTLLIFKPIIFSCMRSVSGNRNKLITLLPIEGFYDLKSTLHMKPYNVPRELDTEFKN